MGESTSQYFAMPHDVLPGVRQVHRALPGHDAEHVERKQHARGMQLGIGMFQEVGDHVRAMPRRDARSGNRSWRLSGRPRQGSARSRTGFRPRPASAAFFARAMSYSCTLGCEGSVHTSLPFSRQAWPVVCDFTASSGCVSTSRWSRKMAMRAMACMSCECRKWVNFGRSWNADCGAARPADDRTECSRCRRCP